MRPASFSAAVLIAIATVASCTPIRPHPISEAPMNKCPEHPCDDYEPGTSVGARCSAGRCEIPTPGGRPDFPFWIVVHVPDTSIFAPGMTFVLFSDKQGEPAFKSPSKPALPTPCSTLESPPCLLVGSLSSVTGSYTVTNQASKDVGYPLADGTSIPVRVVYTPTGNEQRDPFEPTLPLDRLFDASRLVTNQGAPSRAQHSRALPFGKYLRVLYPESPYDRYFPPTADTQTIEAAIHVDNFALGADPPGGKPLDDVTGDSRTATVTREDGLDGWRVWLEDQPSQRRISVIRTLSGTEETVRLDTTGENRGQSGGVGLGDEVRAVVAPPEDSMAVPRFVTNLFGGAGLKNLRYPPIPPPVIVNGVVALSEDGTLLGLPASLTFESDGLATRTDLIPLLHYATTLNTDDRGRFATILPPGNYSVTIEPAEGTGYAKTKQPIVIDRTVTALTLQPAPRPVVRGRVVLTDERPLSEAEILAIPQVPGSPLVAMPRPATTRTLADGRFAFELDPGPYVLTVIPKKGTGFPRVITRPEIPAMATELPDIRVPAPTRLTFTLRDPSPTGNPIVRAVVQILAAVPGREQDPIEIGSAMTDPNGLVEILLAQEPR